MAVIKIRQTFEVWWGNGLKLQELQSGEISLNLRVVEVDSVHRIQYSGVYFYISPSSSNIRYLRYFMLCCIALILADNIEVNDPSPF